MSRKQQHCQHQYDLVTRDHAHEICSKCQHRRRNASAAERNGVYQPKPGEPPWVAEAQARGPVFVRELTIALALIQRRVPGNLIQQVMRPEILQFAIDNGVISTGPVLWTP